MEYRVIGFGARDLILPRRLTQFKLGKQNNQEVKRKFFS